MGFWIMGSEGESAKNWEEILRELAQRGVERVGLFVADGLAGLEEAIKKVFPGADFQRCVLHAVRSTLQKVRKVDRAAVAEALKKIYRAANKEEAKKALEDFISKYAKLYPKAVKLWVENFEKLTTFLHYPLPIRKHIYTTNLLERVFKELKRRLKVMELLQSEGSAERIIFILLQQIEEKLCRRRLPGFEEVFRCEEVDCA